MKKRDYGYSVFSLSCFASLLGLLFGYDTGIISGALLFIQKTLPLSNWQMEAIVSSVLLGAVMGALFNSFYANKISRRKIILMTAFQFMTGSLICAFSSTLLFLVLGRFILGYAIGIASYIAPMYIAEIAPASYRGRLVAINTIAVTFGMLLAYCVNYALSFFEAWRWMLGLGFFPASILAMGIYLFPESPRWLVQQGKMALAKSILEKLGRDTSSAEKEHLLIQQSPLSLKTTSIKYRIPLLIGIVLAVLQQCSGINSVLYYTPIFLTHYHFSSNHIALIISIVVGFINFAMTIIAMNLVDRIGRRRLLLWGLGNSALCLTALALLLPFVLQTSWLTWLALIALFGFISAYAISIGCIFWIIIAEIFPIAIRNTAMGIASAFNWGSNFVVSATTLTLIDHLGISTTLFSYAVFTAVGWIFCFYLIPETARYMLEESSHLSSLYGYNI